MLDDYRRSKHDSFHPLCYVMIKFALACAMVPSSLFVSGVQFAGSDDPICGGFADVFCGKLAGKSVAVKRLRISLEAGTKFFKVGMPIISTNGASPTFKGSL